MTTYLKRVQSTWDVICDKNDAFRLHLDASTVQTLQGRCPAVSEDYEFIVQQRDSLFPRLEDANQRESLMFRIRSIRYVIPSLHTFLEDTKYLELGAKVMKALLPLGCKKSIHETFLDLHNNQKHWTKETAEGGFGRPECSQRQDEMSGDLAHWKAYRQLWIFALRHFPEMTGHSPRKDVSKPKPAHQS